MPDLTTAEALEMALNEAKTYAPDDMSPQDLAQGLTHSLRALGFVIVPVEATYAMCRAAADVEVAQDRASIRDRVATMRTDLFKDRWKAALAAAMVAPEKGPS